MSVGFIGFGGKNIRWVCWLECWEKFVVEFDDILVRSIVEFVG